MSDKPGETHKAAAARAADACADWAHLLRRAAESAWAAAAAYADAVEAVEAAYADAADAVEAAEAAYADAGARLARAAREARAEGGEARGVEVEPLPLPDFAAIDVARSILDGGGE